MAFIATGVSQTRSVLVIDDELKIGELVAHFLREDGVQVFVARDGQEGLSILRQQPVEVLFTDLCLPGEDGVRVLQKALRLRPQLSAVMMTGHGSLESSIDVFRLGACDYITKPLTREKFNAAWSRVLHTRHQRSKLGPRGGRPALTPDLPPESEIVAQSPAMRDVLKTVSRVAPTNVSVLIHGASGVGKGLVASAIHRQSHRAAGPFVQVRCGEVSAARPEAQLFGQARGAFSDSNAQRRGCLELADSGTLFLDHVDELPERAQAMLAKILHDECFERGDSGERMPVDLRVIASSRSDLANEVAEGRFRRDLFDQLNVVSVTVPPLRSRAEDLPPLVRLFLKQVGHLRAASTFSAAELRFSDDAMNCLASYDWPGNVRELASVIERAALLSDDAVLGVETLPVVVREFRPAEPIDFVPIPLGGHLKDIQRSVLLEVLRRCNGNKAAAARTLGLHRRTLYRMLEKERTDS